ncbi:kelch repeat protein [Fusarium oxysporum]|nr:kelch repeat protein [Fusarium oxysporum]
MMASLAEHPVWSISTTIRPQSCQKLEILLLLLLSVIRSATAQNSAQNPRDDFCRRFSHQTTVIDDKLYIDGGWMNFKDFQKDHINYSNTWLGYHDLNKFYKDWPDLRINLNKNDRQVNFQISGGVLWGDDVSKRFYLYGGDWNIGYAKMPYHLLSYDILNDQWEDFGMPNINPPPEIASYGAGIGVSETGMGYYYGGWVSNASMSGWAQPRKMSSYLYTYDYDKGDFTQQAGLDDKSRAEGTMMWIPAGDPQGLLIFVSDATGNSWSTQTATGEIPQSRRQFCVDVAWAPDNSSFNIYLWGGLSVPPLVVNTTSFNDVYILTLPLLIWVKAFPNHHGNATLPPEYGHYGASCNMVKSMSQMLVIGGTYPDTDNCDLAYNIWAQHNFWTGTLYNKGDNKTYWAQYEPNVTRNVVPVDVYSIVGGNKEGHATLKGPKDGFDSGNSLLQTLMARRPSIAQRTPTRQLTPPTNSPGPVSSGSGRLSTGAIVGIAIGSAVGLALVLLIWLYIGRRPSHSILSSTVGAPSIASPQESIGPWGGSPQLVMHPSPSELPTQQDRDMNVISELPQQRTDDKGAVSPNSDSLS